MNKILRYIIGMILLSLVLFFTGCIPKPPSIDDPTPTPTINPASDTTPPTIQVSVRLEVQGDPNVRDEFDITTQDASRERIGSNIVLRLIILANDPESGIAAITFGTNDDPYTGAPQNFLWKCHGSQGSDLDPLFQSTLLPFAFTPSLPRPPGLSRLEAVTDPIATTGCLTTKKAARLNDMSGFIRVTIRNSVGLTTMSKTFSFDYEDAGTTQ